MILAITISLLSLFLISLTMLTCLSCLSRKDKKYEDIKYHKSNSKSGQDELKPIKKPSLGFNGETTSELYQTIPDRLDGVVVVSSTAQAAVSTLSTTTNDLYSCIPNSIENKREDSMLNTSCYSRLPKVPEKRFDVHKEYHSASLSEHGESGSAASSTSAYSKIPNDYESNRTTTNHYDIVPEYETITQLIQEQSTINNEYNNNSIMYMEFSTLNAETVPLSVSTTSSK